jgi:hypothetical protein
MLECQAAFCDVADKFLVPQKARLKGRDSYDLESCFVGHLKSFFTGELADVTPAQVFDYVTARLNAEVRRRNRVVDRSSPDCHRN